VSIKWDFPINHEAKKLAHLISKTSIQAEITYKDEMLTIRLDSIGGMSSAWMNQKKDSIDFVLPAAVDSKPVTLTLPHAYILIVSALIFFGMKIIDQEDLPEFPALKAILTFNDIEERVHSIEFEINFDIIMVSGNAFTAILAPRKIA
jgi:hypothetical protein